jgi:hypothetical protein
VNNHPRSRESGGSPISQICARHALWPGSPFPFSFFFFPFSADCSLSLTGAQGPNSLANASGGPSFQGSLPAASCSRTRGTTPQPAGSFFSVSFSFADHSLSHMYMAPSCSPPCHASPFLSRRPRLRRAALSRCPLHPWLSGGRACLLCALSLTNARRDAAVSWFVFFFSFIR